MIASAGTSRAGRVVDHDDPVADVFRRAKPVPPEEEAELIALLSEVDADVHDPSRWIPLEQFRKMNAARAEANH